MSMRSSMVALIILGLQAQREILPNQGMEEGSEQKWLPLLDNPMNTILL